jgi:GNAT superfamily N-acetyltransferase
MAEFEIARAEVADWERVRAVRLRALRDAPDAFGTLLAEDLARPPDAWQARLRSDAAATFLATRDGADVGLATGAPYDDTAGLFGMFVDPQARGAGVGRALVEAVIEWARSEGHALIRLDVGDHNASAIRLYETCGFLPTGVTSSMPPPRAHVTEHQRIRSLAP